MGMHVCGSPHADPEATVQGSALGGHDSFPLAQGTWQLPTGGVPGDALHGMPGPTIPWTASASGTKHAKDSSTSPSFGTAR
jgi:hypothetical protein